MSPAGTKTSKPLGAVAGMWRRTCSFKRRFEGYDSTRTSSACATSANVRVAARILTIVLGEHSIQKLDTAAHSICMRGCPSPEHAERFISFLGGVLIWPKLKLVVKPNG